MKVTIDYLNKACNQIVYNPKSNIVTIQLDLDYIERPGEQEGSGVREFNCKNYKHNTDIMNFCIECLNYMLKDGADEFFSRKEFNGEKIILEFRKEFQRSR
jgi:hypothetical protein